MDWRLIKKKPKICRNWWWWKRFSKLLKCRPMSKKAQKSKIKRKWKTHVPKRKGQQNPHLTDINRQRSPENKVCLLHSSTSSLTSSTFKACWRQIYKACEEKKSKIVIVVYIICISLLQISGELTRNYFKNKITQARSFPAATQATAQTYQLYFLQCGRNFFYR